MDMHKWGDQEGAASLSGTMDLTSLVRCILNEMLAVGELNISSSLVPLVFHLQIQQISRGPVFGKGNQVIIKDYNNQCFFI